MDYGSSIFILALPALLVIILNIFFLASVVNVLWSKLEFERNFSRKHKNKAMKSARAVLILIPIFGVHFLLLPIRPAEGSSLEYTYEVVSCLSTSSQGVLVSFLLCFANPEILSLMRKKVGSICPSLVETSEDMGTPLAAYRYL